MLLHISAPAKGRDASNSTGPSKHILQVLWRCKDACEPSAAASSPPANQWLTYSKSCCNLTSMWSASPFSPSLAKQGDAAAVLYHHLGSLQLSLSVSFGQPLHHLRVEGSQVQKHQNLQDENIWRHCLWDLDVEPHQWPPIIRDGIDTIPFAQAFTENTETCLPLDSPLAKKIFESSHLANLANLLLAYTALLLLSQQGASASDKRLGCNCPSSKELLTPTCQYKRCATANPTKWTLYDM